MKTMKNFKAIMLLFMVSLFSMTLAAQEQKAEEVTVTYSVHLDCKSCVKKVENHFGPMRGIKKVKCNLQDQTVQLTYSTKRWNVAKIVAEFKKLELDVKPFYACLETPKNPRCGCPC